MTVDAMRINACVRGDITLAEARDVPPEALAAARSLACLVATSGRPDLAVPILTGCVALDPGDAWSWRTLAGIELDRGRVAQAREAASRAASLARTRGQSDPVAAWLVGRVLVAEERPSEAAAWLSSAAADLSAPPAVVASARSLLRRITVAPAARV